MVASAQHQHPRQIPPGRGDAADRWGHDGPAVHRRMAAETGRGRNPAHHGERAAGGTRKAGLPESHRICPAD